MPLSPAYGAPGGALTFGEYIGVFDASSGSFPTANFQGDWFNVTVAGTVDAQPFVVGDILIALVDNPSTTTFAANWTLVPAPSSGLTVGGVPVDNQLAVFTGSNGIEGDANLIWDAAVLTVGATGIQVLNSNGPRLRNVDPSLSIPSIVADRSDLTTGIGNGSVNEFTIICGGFAGFRMGKLPSNDMFVIEGVDGSVTASTTQTQGNGLLNGARYTDVDIIVNDNDVVTLPPVSTGRQMWVHNSTVKILQIFPAVDDDLGEGFDTSRTLAPGGTIYFSGKNSSVWRILYEPDAVSVFGTPADNQIAIWTGDDTIEGLTGLTYDGTDFTVTGKIGVTQAAGPALLNEDASSTNAVIVPNQADDDTGIGRDTVNGLAFIAGAISCMRVRAISSAPAVGFYTTTPIIQQTGVAVTDVAIHAALVALGIFTA